MSDELILRFKKHSFEIPLKSVGEVIWKKLQELNPETTCFVSKKNIFIIKKNFLILLFYNKIEAKSGTKITLKELISQSNSIAVALIKRGITKSDRFCILSANTIPYCVLLFASYFLGVTLVPLSPTFGTYELKKGIEKMESIVIFTSVEKAKFFDEIIENFNSKKIENLKIKSVFVLDGSYGSYIPFERLLEEGKNQLLDKIPHFNVDPKNDYFLLVWSSGTTGLPKTTITSHYSFVASLTDFWTTKQFDPLIV
jgi:long-subunit acyl-CoA synthetase (AMP-forming)